MKKREELYSNIQDTAQKLRIYAELDGSESGEVCAHLINTSQYPAYVSDEFLAALLVELQEQLQGFEETCKIVEEEETVTRTTKKLVELYV